MKMVCGRTVAILSICLGLPLFIIGCEGDKANSAVPKAKCSIEGVYVNHTSPGWIGFWGAFKCKNHDPATTRATFQIYRAGQPWRALYPGSSPVQFTTKCRRGGPVVKFRGRLTVTVQDANTNKWRTFTKLGIPHHWRCLPR
jgi:hypothetical protein